MRGLLAAVVLGSVLFGARAIDPSSVAACSCQPLTTLQDWVDEYPEWGVVVGQVIRDRGDGSYDFAVARWYGGEDRRPIVVVRSNGEPNNGTAVMDSCGGSLTPGRRFLFYGAQTEDETYRIGFCSLIADPASERGQALERHAVELIGPAEEPQADAGEPTRPTPTTIDPPVVAVGMVGAVVVLFGGVILIGRRRRVEP